MPIPYLYFSISSKLTSFLELLIDMDVEITVLELTYPWLPFPHLTFPELWATRTGFRFSSSDFICPWLLHRLYRLTFGFVFLYFFFYCPFFVVIFIKRVFSCNPVWASNSLEVLLPQLFECLGLHSWTTISGFILLLFLNLGSSASLNKIFPQVISSISKVLHFSLVSQISGASSSYLTTYRNIFHYYFSLGSVKI